MIVADTNLLIYLLVPTERTDAAEAAFQRDPAWSAPPLWRSEFLNALVQYTRQDLLTPTQARRAYREAQAILDDRVYPVEGNVVLDLAIASGCSGYDCEFVALAQHLEVPMVTADQKVLRAFPQVTVGLTTFATSSG